jgi:hypothetical protein
VSRRLLLAVLLLSACTDDVTAYFAVPGSSTADDFYALPFPNDLRRHPDGSLDLSEFPTNSPIADLGRHIAEQDLDGFGMNAAIFFRFSGGLAPESLPDPAGSLADDASVYLVDIDPDSPSYGERTPIVATFHPEGTQTIGGNRLVVRPYPGFPLSDATTYAVVVTNRVATADGGDLLRASDFAAVVGTSGGAAIKRARSSYAPLLDWLDAAGGDERDDLVVATVFTTQHATGFIPAIRKGVYGTPAPVARDVINTVMGSGFYLFIGAYDAPNFQEGDPPYISEGGRVVVGADGVAVVQRTEVMRFMVAVPNGPVPAGGFPICIFQHGTHGDWMSFFQQNIADRLTQQGIAVIGTDQVLHGPRDPTMTDPGLSFYNLNNPVAGRDNALQGAADGWSQLRLVLGMSITDVNARTITFDPTRVYFYGHSQGSHTGAAFIAFEPSLDGAVMSGTAGVFYLNMLDKTAPINFPDLLPTLFRDEPFDEDNPTLALAQMLVERTDPVNYAPLVVRRPPLADDGVTRLPARNVLQLEGFVDNYTPNRSIEAYATALGTDLAMTAALKPIEGLDLRGRTALPLPIANNVDGTTVVLAQYKAAGNNDGHFVHTDVAAARTQIADFLGSLAATGTATVK